MLYLLMVLGVVIAYYDATTSKLTYLGDETYTKEEIAKINTRVKNEMKMDNLAIEKNYFAYLEKNLYKDKQEDSND